MTREIVKIMFVVVMVIFQDQPRTLSSQTNHCWSRVETRPNSKEESGTYFHFMNSHWRLCLVFGIICWNSCDLSSLWANTLSLRASRAQAPNPPAAFCARRSRPKYILRELRANLVRTPHKSNLVLRVRMVLGTRLLFESLLAGYKLSWNSRRYRLYS